MTTNATLQNSARVIALAAIWLSPEAVCAQALESIPGFDATYSVRYGILRGTMTLKLSRDEAGFLYETTLSPRGVAAWIRRGKVSEQSVLESVDGIVRPLNYVSTDTIARPNRSTRYLFDQESGRVTGKYKSQIINEPLRTGGHNRISAHIAIMAALNLGPEISGFPVFDRARWKDYQFEILPDQTTDTPSGKFDTIEVRYASTDNKSWSLHCAARLHYLPVMIVYREGGKVKSRAQLTEYWIAETNHPN